MSMNQLVRELQSSGGLERLAGQFGLDADAAGQLSSMLAPAMGKAARKQMDSGNAETVLSQFRGEGLTEFFDQPEAAAQPAALSAGQSFLENLFDSKEAPQALASEAASRASIDPAKAMAFLPALAAALQGGMQKKAPDSELDNALSSFMGNAGGAAGLMGAVGGLLGGNKGGASGSGGALGMISGLLDADGDGSPLDDIVEKYMPKR